MEYVDAFGADALFRSGALTTDPNLHPTVLNSGTLTSMAHLSASSNGFSPSMASLHQPESSPFSLGNVGLFQPGSSGQLAPMHMYTPNHQLYSFATMAGIHTPVLSGAPATPVMTSVSTPGLMPTTCLSKQWNVMETHAGGDETSNDDGEL